MTERETGELIANQKAMKEQLDKVEKAVTEIASKVSVGKGLVLGISMLSGGVGAIIAGVISTLSP